MSTSTGIPPKTTLEDADVILGKDSSLFTTTFDSVKDYIKTKLIGTSTLGWSNLIMPFSAAKGNGTTEPVWSDTGNGLYAFLFTTGDELMTSGHVTHDYAVGTVAYPHIHWFTDETMTPGQQLTWRVNWICAKGHVQGDSLTAATTQFDMVFTADGTEVAGEHIITECSIAQALDLIEPDAICKFKFELLSSNVSGNVFGEQADLHYQIDRIATKNKAPDFYT